MKNLLKKYWPVLVVVLILVVGYVAFNKVTSHKAAAAAAYATEAPVVSQPATEAPVAEAAPVVEPTPGTMTMEIVASEDLKIQSTVAYVFVKDDGSYEIQGSNDVSVVSASVKGVEALSKSPDQNAPFICIPATGQTVGPDNATEFDCGFQVMP